MQAEIGPERAIPTTLVFDYPRIRDLATFLIETLKPDDSAPSESTVRTIHPSSPLVGPNRPATEGRDIIESMSEEEALQELMRELDSN